MKKKIIPVLLLSLLISACEQLSLPGASDLTLPNISDITSIDISDPSSGITTDNLSDSIDIITSTDTTVHSDDPTTVPPTTSTPPTTEPPTPITTTTTPITTTPPATTTPTPVDPDPDDTYFGDYYQSIRPTDSGTVLRNNLQTLISVNFAKKSYDSLPDIYRYSDVENSKMVMFYTFTARTFSSGSLPGKTNKEHVWPQSSYGGTGTGTAGSDAHNIYPCDAQLNNVRSNYGFDVLPQTANTRAYEGGSGGSYGESGGNLNYGDPSDPDSYNYVEKNNKGAGRFYPRAGYRGMTARSLMYTAVRYGFTINEVAKTTDSGQKTIGKLSVLLRWHFEEPVTEFEINRNQQIYERWHNNRNPFVDKPSLACRVFGNDSADALNVCNAYAK